MTQDGPGWREGLRTWCATLDGLNRRIGTLLAFLLLLLILLAAAITVARSIFGVASLPFRGTIVVVGAAVMLGGSGFALLMDEHLRVGVRYRNSTQREQARVSIVGYIAFVLPMLVMLLWTTGLAVVRGAYAMRGAWSNVPLTVLVSGVAFFAVLAVAVQAHSCFLRAWLRR